MLLPVDLDTLRVLALALAGGEHHVDVVGTPRLRVTSPTSGGLATSVAPHETGTYHVSKVTLCGQFDARSGALTLVGAPPPLIGAHP